MTTRPIHLAAITLAAASSLGAELARAQAPADDTIPIPRLLLTPVPPRLSSVSLSYTLGLNVRTRFRNLGGVSAPGTAVGPAARGTNHYYNDGYNLVDDTGNLHGTIPGTWHWGYQNASQIQGDSVAMHSSSVAAGANSTDNKAGLQHGFELGLRRELGRHEHWRWGVAGAFGFTDVSVHDDHPVAGNGLNITDTYSLYGNVPPGAPYNGTAAGPGAIISDLPARTNSVIHGAALITGSRDFDAMVFAFKLGPYLEVPLSHRWSLDLRGGLAVVEVSSRFSYRETTTVFGVTEPTTSASSSASDLLLGGFAAANVSYAVSDAVSLLCGVQFQDVGQYTHRLNGREAALDLNNSFSLFLGLAYSF